MVSVLVLSDQERLLGLFARPDLLGGCRVRIAGSIGAALEALAVWKPACIFIQDRVGEVSGQVIAHRLGTGGKGKKPRIILIGDPSEMVSGGSNPAWTVLDAAMPDDELMTSIREIVVPKDRGGKKRSAPRGPKVADTVAVSPEPLPGPSPATDGVDDLVLIGGTVRRDVRPVSETEDGSDGAGSHAARSGFQEKLQQALEVAAVSEHAGAGTSGRETAAFTGQGSRRTPVTPGAAPVTLRKDVPWFRSRLLRLGLAGIGMTLLLLFLMLRPGKQTAPVGAGKPLAPPPGAAARPPVSVPRRIVTLPSTVSGRPDPAYGKSHRGWERYLNPAAEFRVYRENGSIRALQVMGRSGHGISALLFESTLKEIAGSSGYVVETRTRQGNYLVEKGRLKNGAGIIIYRREPDRLVRAFVVDFS